MAKRWTPEELAYLQDSWGVYSIETIAKNLNRSINAVRLKAQRIGLGDPTLHFDGITVHQLSKALNISYSIILNWIQRYNFPAWRKKFSKNWRVLVVTYKDFWKWAEEHKHMIDFSRLEENLLGPEPEWAKEKRNADRITNLHIEKSYGHEWTEEEDNILKSMLNAYCYTYPEIAARLKRSEGAIKRRIQDLGLKQRPVRLNNHIKYTKEEVQLMEEMLEKGYCLEEIASRIGKSALGVRGKLERMGYRFINGVPIKKEA